MAGEKTGSSTLVTGFTKRYLSIFLDSLKRIFVDYIDMRYRTAREDAGITFAEKRRTGDTLSSTAYNLFRVAYHIHMTTLIADGPDFRIALHHGWWYSLPPVHLQLTS